MSQHQKTDTSFTDILWPEGTFYSIDIWPGLPVISPSTCCGSCCLVSKLPFPITSTAEAPATAINALHQCSGQWPSLYPCCQVAAFPGSSCSLEGDFKCSLSWTWKIANSHHNKWFLLKSPPWVTFQQHSSVFDSTFSKETLQEHEWKGRESSQPVCCANWGERAFSLMSLCSRISNALTQKE